MLPPASFLISLLRGSLQNGSNIKFIFTLQFATVRYFIELSYLGTAYCGWQNQPNGISVQASLEKSLFTLLRREIPVTGQGRTDAGVHALKTFAHVDVNELPFDEKIWAYKWNALLPADISVQKIMQVKDDAHARFSARRRFYRYRICTKKNPFENGRAWMLYRTLETADMLKAAAYLKGAHDFTSFSSARSDTENRICTVDKISIHEQDGILMMDISADRFVMNMVRTIMGTLAEVGLGKRQAESIPAILSAKNRESAGENAPPQGLFLTDVEYPSDIFLL